MMPSKTVYLITIRRLVGEDKVPVDEVVVGGAGVVTFTADNITLLL